MLRDAAGRCVSSQQIADWRARRDSNPQPSDPKIVPIHNHKDLRGTNPLIFQHDRQLTSACYGLFSVIVETPMETNRGAQERDSIAR